MNSCGVSSACCKLFAGSVVEIASERVVSA
jgi:hypothetical protein